MSILGLRILPPMAIGRFGSSPTPLAAFDLEPSKEGPLGFREIVTQATLVIDPVTGAVTDDKPPNSIEFKDEQGRIRPVAPFLEVFAQTSEDPEQPLVSLSTDLLAAEGLGPDAVHWTVRVGNLKVFRQTHEPKDKILASVIDFNDHDIHPIKGECENFLAGKFIPFGSVRYVRPTPKHKEIRLRFTPAAGRVYGSSLRRNEWRNDQKVEVDDPVFAGDETRIVYDKTKGWWNFKADAQSRTLPNPSDIYQGYWPPSEPLPIGWGYLDDVCDGPVSVKITLKGGRTLAARAWISSCMPVFAPDSQPIRTVADEVEQIILGAEVATQDVSLDEAAEIVLRALETIRLMNTRVMNANVIGGRANIASTLYRQDANDYGRQYEPAMASTLADNLAVRLLHERVYAALKSGSAPWFAKLLRQPEEIGNLSDESRRKMPPMLRGADGRALTLTRRQISMIAKAAVINLFQ